MFNLILKIQYPISLIFFGKLYEANLSGNRLSLFSTGMYSSNGIFTGVFLFENFHN